jgi:putative ATPase
VPDHLKDGNRDAEALGHGESYQYPHGFPGHWVEQQYLPDRLKGSRWYQPGELGYERTIRERLTQQPTRLQDEDPDS